MLEKVHLGGNQAKEYMKSKDAKIGVQTLSDFEEKINPVHINEWIKYPFGRFFICC